MRNQMAQSQIVTHGPEGESLGFASSFPSSANLWILEARHVSICIASPSHPACASTVGNSFVGGGTATGTTTTTRTKQKYATTKTFLPKAQIVPSVTQLTIELTKSGATFTTTTQGYNTVATYYLPLYYYTTSGTHRSTVCTSTLTQETVFQVTASNEKDAQYTFASMLYSIEQEAKPTPIPITKDTVNPCQSGISTSEKAGIGVGASIGAVLIIALAFFLLWRRRKRQQRAGDRPYVDGKAELEGFQGREHWQGEAKKGETEIDGRDISEAPQKIEEIGYRTSRYELEGDWRGNELT